MPFVPPSPPAGSRRYCCEFDNLAFDTIGSVYPHAIVITLSVTPAAFAAIEGKLPWVYTVLPCPEQAFALTGAFLPHTRRPPSEASYGSLWRA